MHGGPRFGDDSSWTDAAIQKLRALWAEGHSTARIGDMMGLTKNAIVGKAHRLGLPSRPSPIRRDAEGPRKPRVVRRAPPVTLPRLGAAEAPIVVAAAPAPVPVLRVAPRAREACCWPIGEPRSRSFRYCDEPAESGRPYCAAHVEKAYSGTRVNVGPLPW